MQYFVQSFAARQPYPETYDLLMDIIQTQGLQQHTSDGSKRSQDEVEKLDRQLSQQRSQEVKAAVPHGGNQWSTYPAELKSPKTAKPQSSKKRK